MGIVSRTPTTTTHTQKTMPSCIKIALVLFASSLVECFGYILPNNDYDENQLLLLNQLLEGSDQTNTRRISVDYLDPINVLELEPTDEEIVEALLKQLENPAQSEALYEELIKSKVIPHEDNAEESVEIDSNNLKHQLHTLAELAHPDIIKHRGIRQLPSRRKRSIPPYINPESRRNQIHNF